MRSFLFSFCLFLFSSAAIAQQDPQFSQNMFLKLSVNPAYAGSTGAFCATAVYRNQWVGFPGAPKTFLFCADAPLKVLHGGAGIKVMNDRLGNFNFTSASAIYSYHKPVGSTGLIGIGLEGVFMHTVVTNNWLTPSGTLIQDPNTTTTNYNLGLGAYYRTMASYIGLSVSDLLPQETCTSFGCNSETTRHYYLMAGYTFLLTSSSILEPSLFLKSDDVVTTFDLNLCYHWNNFLWAGVSYRLQDAVVLMAGVSINPTFTSTFMIGYSYDIGISDLKAYHDNTHEILVRYCVRFIKKQVKSNPEKSGKSGGGEM